MGEFERAAESQKPSSFFGEFWAFLRQSKKWWLAPIIVILALFGLLIALSGTAAAPFIYTLF
ncbi:MAG: DUF5989 family protein [Vicinamibacterales bacterium]